MNFYRLSLTQSANLMGLTPAIVGFAVARAVGVGPAVASIGLACTLTALAGSVSAAMAVSYREPTAAISRHLFGQWGPRLMGAALGTTLIGWFSLHAMALLQALPALSQAAALPAPRAACLLAAAAVSLWVVRQGNEGIARINAVQGPLLVAAMAWAALRAGGCSIPVATLRPDPAFTAMIFAAGLGDVVDLPSVMHRASSRTAAVAASWMSYAVVLPALLLLGATLSCQADATSAVNALAAGPIAWRVSVCALTVGSACLGNAGLIYSGGLSVATALGRAPQFLWRAVVTACAVALAMSPLSHRLEWLLDFLGIATGSVGLLLLATFAADGLQAAPSRTVRQSRVRVRAVVAVAGLSLLGFFTLSSPGISIAIACGGGAACGATLTLWERSQQR